MANKVLLGVCRPTTHASQSNSQGTLVFPAQMCLAFHKSEDKKNLILQKTSKVVGFLSILGLTKVVKKLLTNKAPLMP